MEKLVLNAGVVKQSNQNLHSVFIYNITFIFSILIPSPPPIADAAMFTFNKLGNDSTNCCFPSANWLGNVVCTSGIVHRNGVSTSIQSIPWNAAAVVLEVQVNVLFPQPGEAGDLSDVLRGNKV